MKSALSCFTRAFAALMLGALVLLTPARAQTQPTSMLAPPASAYTAAVAYEWFYLVSQLLQQTPGNSPPVAARTLGYLGLTLYESVVPGMPGHQSLAGQLNELSSLPWAQPDEPLHWPTVANASMATMTRMMFSNASAENKGRIDLLERSLPLKYPDDFDPSTITADITNRSETFGKLMAMAIMTWARTDGGHEAWGPLRRTRLLRKRVIRPFTALPKRCSTSAMPRPRSSASSPCTGRTIRARHPHRLATGPISPMTCCVRKRPIWAVRLPAMRC